MNMSHDGITVSFKTEPQELFLAEKSGAKLNTVRILDLDEWKRINSSPPKKIIIQNQQEVFLRTLTHICRAGILLGKVIVIFSWANEAHPPSWVHSGEKTTGIVSFPVSEEYAARGPHSMPEQDPDIIAHVHSVSHEPGIDETFAAITISKGTLTLLQSIAHGRTMNKVIQELYEAYINRRTSMWRPLHD